MRFVSCFESYIYNSKLASFLSFNGLKANGIAFFLYERHNNKNIFV